MSELKSYPPASEFVSRAHVKSRADYQAVYEAAKENPEAFWGKLAREKLDWFEPFTKTLEWNAPFAKWFSGGKINACYNCVDRHLKTDRRDKPAIIFEGEPGDERVISYQETAPAGLSCRHRNQETGIQRRRPSHHLYADDSGAADSGSGMCAAGHHS